MSDRRHKGCLGRHGGELASEKHTLHKQDESISDQEMSRGVGRCRQSTMLLKTAMGKVNSIRTRQ